MEKYNTHRILTLAFGFKELELSELTYPIKELGYKPRTLATEFAAEADDVELAGFF
jgi:hypothetical protein